jgi:regulation of enolase protein 1 (concanavalin A-like superfamily)
MRKTTLFLMILLMVLSVSAQLRDGTLMRSESRQEFDATKVKGDFYVSPNGNDNWSGTLAEPNAAGTDGPFATIKRAQQGVRELKSQVYQAKKMSNISRYIGSNHPLGKGKDIVVFIRKGLYTLSAPLEFKPKDGGERVETSLPTGAFEFNNLRDHYVTYAAFPGEKPVITGGLEVTNWEKTGNCWVAPFTQENATSLIANGQKQTPARTPDSGYFTVEKLTNNSELNFRKGDMKNWREMAYNRVILLMRWNIAENSIARVDEKNQIAYLARSEPRLLLVPPRYYVENVKDAMDQPGEWYFDKGRKEISYIPVKGISNPNEAMMSVPRYNQLITVTGEEGRPVRNLRFYGLTFDGVTAGGTVISFEYAHGCELENSELSNSESTAVKLGFGCTNTRIANNLFRQLKRGAIQGRGPKEIGNIRQQVKQTMIYKNKFIACGGDVVQFLYTNFTTISHNYFYKSYWPNCISCQWGNMEEEADGSYLVEYNHFDDMQNDADDTGVIKLAGLTVNSFVRNNLFHKVHRGFTNENVPVWFDCLAKDWVVEKNIYYDIEQRMMKLNGAYLTDNIYRDNELIEPPQNAPEEIIEGLPAFVASNLNVSGSTLSGSNSLPTGSVVKVSADIFNSGSTGFAPVFLYINGKVFQTKEFPVIKNNSRRIEFVFRLLNSGRQEIAIGETPAQMVNVVGEKPSVVFDLIRVSEERVLSGECIKVSATARNVQQVNYQSTIRLYVNGRVLKSLSLLLKPMEEKEVQFEIFPDVGVYPVRIENSSEIMVVVSKYRELDLKKEKLLTYLSAKSKPANVLFDPINGSYKIAAAGSDFFHAEDAYAAVYLRQLKGDFVAKVKVDAFGEKTEAWFRAGLYARNDITQSFDVVKGSLGSVLMFTTPNRAGIEYDEFGDGSMHKAASENLPENTTMPVWLKLERHGNTYSGYVSVDGKNWIIQRKSTPLPGLTEAVDLGLAAGSSNGKQYAVTFSGWSVKVQE